MPNPLVTTSATGLSVCLLFLAFVCGRPCHATAQPAGSAVRSGDAVILNDGVPREVRDVTVEQKLGQQITKTLVLIDSEGRKLRTGQVFDGEKPVIVTLNYSSCPMLCSVQLNALVQSVNDLQWKIGDDFRMLTVSIDPKETTGTIRKTKSSYIERLPEQPGAASDWTFATASQPVIKQLADELGFRYRYDKASGEYYHPAMLAFVSPDGVITRYSLSVDFPRDQLKLALVEAGEGKVGNVIDQFVLWCYSYDPEKNSYVSQAWKLMRWGGALTIGIMLAMLAPYWFGRKGAVKSAGELAPSEQPAT